MVVQINETNKTFSFFNEDRNEWETSSWFESGAQNEAGNAESDEDLSYDDAMTLADDREWERDILAPKYTKRVFITSVSKAAARMALRRLACGEGMIYTSPNHALSGVITAEIIGENKVKIESTYFTECSLMEIAEKAAGRGTVKAGL
jgi:hypothetical protein